MSGTTEQIKCKSCHAILDVMGQAGGIVACDYCGTQNLLNKEVRRLVADDSHQFMIALYQAMADEFSMDELDILIARASGQIPAVYRLDPEDIAGRTPKTRSLELVQWFKRRSLLQSLVDVVVAVRPAIDINVYMRS